MDDLEIRLSHAPSAVAELGAALGKAGVNIEGGGVFTVNNEKIAHFLFENGAVAQQALEAAGIEVIACRKVLVQKLKQEEPGQLGKFTLTMANAGVNIEVLYSDHHNQLILVVDNYELGARISQQWKNTG